MIKLLLPLLLSASVHRVISYNPKTEICLDDYRGAITCMSRAEFDATHHAPAIDMEPMCLLCCESAKELDTCLPDREYAQFNRCVDSHGISKKYLRNFPRACMLGSKLIMDGHPAFLGCVAENQSGVVR